MASHSLRRTWLFFSLAFAVALAFIPGLVQAQRATPPVPAPVATPPAPAGNYYVVQIGDNWSIVAWRNGLTLYQLRAANPQVLRPGDVLWPGDRLFIPLAPGAQAAGAAPSRTGYWYITRQGDTWQTVARDVGVTVLDLWHANPGQLNSGRTLYPGVRLWVPAAPPSPTPSAVARTKAPVVRPTGTPKAAPVPAATVSSPAIPPTVSGSGTTGCPGQFGDYPAAIAGRLNVANTTADSVRSWLAACGAVSDEHGAVMEASIQSQASDDYLVILSDPSDTEANSPDRLLVYHGQPTGYSLAGVAQGQGKIAVLRVDDINGDGQTDIVWTDTACTGATCRSTLFVDSWDGTAYRSSIEGQPVTPAAQYSFQPVPGSNTYAIVIRSSSSGASQPETVTYVSTAGGLYHPLPAAASQQVGPTLAPTRAAATAAPPSPPEPPIPAVQNATATPTTPAGANAAPATPAAAACLWDRVESADQTFDSWPSTGFAPAIQAYQAAVDDTASIACGQVKDELTLLRDFARVRLMVALSGDGKIAQTSAIRDQISTPALKGAADAFLSSYQDSHSLIQACRDASAYAKARPESWQFMVDLGDAKFTADDVCPLAK
jgi:LysM repeat protein